MNGQCQRMCFRYFTSTSLFVLVYTNPPSAWGVILQQSELLGHLRVSPLNSSSGSHNLERAAHRR
jgi:hypothetical protein